LIDSVSYFCSSGIITLSVIAFYFYVYVSGSQMFVPIGFVKPDGCILLAQFTFDVLIRVYFFSLLGV
jgi:hypothetical protein